MSPYISDDAFLPKDVNNKQKTVTLPLEEYEHLVNAQKSADIVMRKAKSMIEKNEVQIVLHRERGSQINYCVSPDWVAPKLVLPLDCLRSFGKKDASEELEKMIDEASNHIRQECSLKLSECNTEVERCRGILNAILDYNKKGALYRFFNPFTW